VFLPDYTTLLDLQVRGPLCLPACLPGTLLEVRTT
jgi:hypothetical protein